MDKTPLPAAPASPPLPMQLTLISLPGVPMPGPATSISGPSHISPLPPKGLPRPPAQQPATTPALTAVAPPPLDTGTDIAEAARHWVRKDAGRRPDPMALQETGGRQALPPPRSPLERTLALRTGRREEALPGGGLRIISPNGERYCLETLPEAARRDGPVEPMMVPMRCP